MTLSNGYLFELTWDQDGSSQTAVAIHLPIERPSAKPLHGPAVFQFTTIGGGQTFKCSASEIDEVHPIALTDLPPAMIDPVATSVVDLVEREPDRVPIEDLQVLLREVENEAAYDTTTLIVARVLDTHDDLPDDLVADVIAFLERDDVSQQWDDVAFARPATQTLARISERNPAAVFDFVPNLAIAGELEDLATRRAVVYTFTRIVSEYPEEVLPVLDLLVDGIASDDENMQQNALSALGRIVKSYPDAAAPVADEVATLFESDDASVRANAVGVFGDLAVGDPETTIRYAPELLELLRDEDRDVRRNASIALLRAGEANPEIFHEDRAILGEALEDDVTEVRRNVCSIIGNARVDVPDDRLERLAEDDPDDIVQERAAWAVDRLDYQ